MVAARTVLYVEDNPINVLLVERVLAAGPPCGCSRHPG